MSSSTNINIRQLTSSDLSLMEAMLSTFGQAFDETDIYLGARPSPTYLKRMLNSDEFIALAALKGEKVVGGLAAYELHKFEQERSEIFIYDLAVAAAHRRKGIATALIEELRKIALMRGAYLIFVQAELDDEPAIALYSNFAKRQDIVHFDVRTGR